MGNGDERGNIPSPHTEGDERSNSVNRAFYIIAAPAFIVSFLWMYYAWGLKLAVPVIGTELAVAIWGVIHLRRKAAQSAARGHATNR